MFKQLLTGAAIVAVLTLAGCESANLRPENNNPEAYNLDVAQASGQLASGSSFNISGSSTEGLQSPNGRFGGGPKYGGKHHDRKNGILDGFSLLAPTPELLAIIEAESAGDIRGMKMGKIGGASISHYAANGTIITLPLPEDGPHGHSFSGKENPELDSLLSLIARTEIDFGAGVTFTRDTVSITRKGKITITRTFNPANKTRTEVVTFTDYAVNENRIFGIKTRVHTFDEATQTVQTVSTVENGRIVFSDGTEATWTSDKTRNSAITKRNSDGRPDAGTITISVDAQVKTSDGTVIYSHKTTTPLVEKFECRAARRRGPVSGMMETNYRADLIVVDFGNGNCSDNKATVTINGVVSERTID